MASWTPLANQPPFNADTMLLLTDGTVMCHELYSANWYRLTPDSTGSYINGTWSSLAPLPNNSNIPGRVGGPTNAPLYFASAVLRDGRVFVSGGEYNTDKEADINATQIYNPVGDTWTAIPPPPDLPQIGDAPSCVLADGKLIIGTSAAGSNAVDIFDPNMATYKATGAKGDSPSEETWTLLPNGNVLATQCSNAPNAEQYNPANDEWISVGNTPSNLTQPCANQVGEIGPALLLPTGTVFAIGASGVTAIYKPNADPTMPGTWSAGPNLTDNNGNTLFPMDAPAVLLSSGKVLLTGSPAPPCEFPEPTIFLLYDPSANSVAVVAGPSNSSKACYWGRLLLLPTGQALFSNGSNQIEVYTPDGSPQASWAPTITSYTSILLPGQSFKLSGTQLNGLSQACSYGDDAQMATNYPIVRITDSQGSIRYCRTANHSSMGVATGRTVQSTTVTLPSTIAAGRGLLTVIANGIASSPVTVELNALR